MSTRATSVVVAALLGAGLSACGASAQGTKASASASAAPLVRAACGPGAAEALARAAGQVGIGIYAGELASAETRSDKRQIESYGPLLSAVAHGERAAIQAAVTSLVFSHTHVVRLLVSRGSTVLADVGGPYILAPVGGSLRLNGRTIAHYVLSVQDDLGYVKLVSRFLGIPLVMRAGTRDLPVQGLLAGAPSAIPAHGAFTFRHRRYEAYSFDARSFPSGPLRISLLVPVPGGLSGRSCAEIKSAELAHAAQLVSRRFSLTPASLHSYIKLVRSLTGGLLYVRAGSRTLAGTTSPGPGLLPSAGPASYRGANYEVSSFLAPSSAGQVRVYQLVRA